MPTLSALHLYPIKGARGTAVSEAAVDDHGFVDDRRYLVVDEAGRFVNQRQVARLALLVPTLEPDALVLRVADGRPGGEVRVPRGAAALAAARIHGPRPERDVVVWRDTVRAEDCGDAAAAWLSEFLGQPVRLVHAGAGYVRPIPAARLPATLAGAPADATPLATAHGVSFADAFPFLVIGEASLADLNDRLLARGGEALPMDRFRPNLVVRDAPPYAEDTWARWRTRSAGSADDGVLFHAAGPCARCIVTTTDQQRGERDGPEPLRTLATYRRDPCDAAHVEFGQNLIHAPKRGRVRVGDEVVVG